MTDREVTLQLKAALIRRFAWPEWVTCAEVLCGTRSIDYVAVHTWGAPELLGFELKASRSDWLREMRQPEKADQVFGQLDRFWLVTAASVTTLQEVPPTWGWLTLQADGRLRAAKPAQKIARLPLDQVFVAGLMRRARAGADDQDRLAELKAARESAHAEGRKFERDHSKYSQEVDAAELDGARRLRAAYGYDLYQAIERAPRIKELLAGGRAEQRLQQLLESARQVAEVLEQIVPTTTPLPLTPTPGGGE